MLHPAASRAAGGLDGSPVALYPYGAAQVSVWGFDEAMAEMLCSALAHEGPGPYQPALPGGLALLELNLRDGARSNSALDEVRIFLGAQAQGPASLALAFTRATVDPTQAIWMVKECLPCCGDPLETVRGLRSIKPLLIDEPIPDELVTCDACVQEGMPSIMVPLTRPLQREFRDSYDFAAPAGLDRFAHQLAFSLEQLTDLDTLQCVLEATSLAQWIAALLLATNPLEENFWAH